jgi:hypothetical protein
VAMRSPQRPIQVAGDDRRDPEPPTAAEVPPAGAPPFDWQVLLMRYLPRPVGSSHVIKRLAPR